MKSSIKPITRSTILNALKQANNPLIPTQNKLSLPIISRIFKKMYNGIKFEDIKVCDDLIIDGHHRYIGAMLANKILNQVKSSKTSHTVLFDWNKVEFVHEEWDTLDKIKQLNEKDARFNDISIAQLMELTK